MYFEVDLSDDRNAGMGAWNDDLYNKSRMLVGTNERKYGG